MAQQLTKKGNNKKRTMWVVVGIALVVIVGVGAALALFMNQDKNQDANNFASCQAAGGTVSDGNPAECSMDGATYIEGEDQDAADQPGSRPADEDGKGTDAYVGLDEQEALDKARSENKPARVVERDGETQMVTMDVREGRLNFTVKDGKVTSVEEETLRGPEE